MTGHRDEIAAQQIRGFRILGAFARQSRHLGTFRIALQEFAALLFECRNFSQYHFDVLALLLKNTAPLLQHLLQTLDLRPLILGRIVHIDKLTYLGQRQTESLASQRQFEPHLVAVAVHPVTPRPIWHNQSMVLVETDPTYSQSNPTRLV